MGKKGVPHRKFSKEDKLKIIREHLDGHEAIEALEKKYKIGHSSIDFFSCSNIIETRNKKHLP